jgi:hypothetical protein
MGESPLTRARDRRSPLSSLDFPLQGGILFPKVKEAE